ncbi:MAG: amidohydrolase family protein [Burkholderiales bacterium]|nr:amidohydrolase family protein [Burkholderiales bacterium]
MSVLFRDAQILDGSGAAPFRGDLRVDGQRIAAVGAPGSIAADARDRIVDCAGATLMPGLVEPHAHLSFLDQSNPAQFSAVPVEEHLLATLRHAKLYLDCGFTSCFSAAATKPRLDVVVRDAIDRGEHPGPRLRAASLPLAVTGGVGDLRQLHLDPGEAMYTLPCDGPVEFRRAAREACREGVDVLKIVPSGDTSTPAIPSPTTLMADDEVAAVCEVARERGRRVAAHARSAASVKMCVRHGVDVIYHATCADAEALDMLEAAKDRVFVAPAMSVTWTRLHESGKYGLPSSPAMRARIERDLEMTCERMVELRKRGVRVLPGGDYGFAWNPHGNNARDLAFFVDLMGFTPMEAIVAATKWGGELMCAPTLAAGAASLPPEGAERAPRGGPSARVTTPTLAAGAASLPPEGAERAPRGGPSARVGTILPGELGVLRTGALADLLLVDGDPLADVAILQDRARLRAIMKDGVFHKAPP